MPIAHNILLLEPYDQARMLFSMHVLETICQIIKLSCNIDP